MGLLSIYESGAYGARIRWNQSEHFKFYFSFEAQSSALPGGAEGVGFEPTVLQRTVGRPILTMNGPCPLAFLSGTKDSCRTRVTHVTPRRRCYKRNRQNHGGLQKR